jgi:hypothetical protein
MTPHDYGVRRVWAGIGRFTIRERPFGSPPAPVRQFFSGATRESAWPPPGASGPCLVDLNPADRAGTIDRPTAAPARLTDISLTGPSGAGPLFHGGEHRCSPQTSSFTAFMMQGQPGENASDVENYSTHWGQHIGSATNVVRSLRRRPGSASRGSWSHDHCDRMGGQPN